MRIVTPFALVVVVFFIAAISCKSESKPEPRPRHNAANQPLQAEGFVVRTKELSEKIQVPGTLLPFEATEIRPEISGRIVELNIPEGRVVEKGTVLVKLFDGDLQARLKKLEVQLSIAQKTVERQKALLDISGISQQEYDLSELEANNLSADIELVKVEISKTKIKAPYTGRIGLKNISLGAYVTPTNILTAISQVNELKLEFTVPEKYSENMRPGREVVFDVNGIDKQFRAAVMATEAGIEANTRTLKVRAVVKGRHDELVSGGFASVSLELGEKGAPLVIPTQAIIPKARTKEVVVFRSGQADFTTVTTGIRDSTFVQVLDGLKEGDTIVTTALLAIRPESKISLTKVN
ncbi:MAG: efflux RND transporter periplasmic adaptor subunit [Chitinophagaceae bacterium]|nr:efflux RND transporter periplasmic adaptor subunit [Chitinophagaceae bacterium]